MFGIIADIAKETVKTVKCVDDAITGVYKDAKESSEVLGVGPESQREVIRDIGKMFSNK